MLLFSTLLPINETMTHDKFIELVIEWNQGSPHSDNVIPNIEWHGEHNIRYGNDTLWMEIQEYRNRNIIAVRFEKTDSTGGVWDTDYVMNFNDMMMSIRLDRSYLEEALRVDPSFSTPHFITLLINNGYLKGDNNLRVLRTPVIINEKNLSILTDVINCKEKYRLPIVYISKTIDDEDPVDVWKLSGRLKGIAHVLVEESNQLNRQLMFLCNRKNPYYGAIGVYYPGSQSNQTKLFYNAPSGFDERLFDKVLRSVLQYSNSQKIDTLYTWPGLNTALYKDRWDYRGAELIAAAERQKQTEEETGELIDYADEENRNLRKRLEDATKEIERLTVENQGFRSKLSEYDAIPILYLGQEDEFYRDEIKAILIDALKKAHSAADPQSRRAHVLQDVVRSNPCEHLARENAEKIKSLLKGYKNVSASIKQELISMGFTITDEGKHYKLFFHNDRRYCYVIPKTPSDHRSGMNAAADIIKNIF